MPARRYASFFPQRMSSRVPGGAYSAALDNDDTVTDYLGIPDAQDTDAILVAQSIATAGSTTTFAATYTGSVAQMGPFGRAIRVVASGAATSLFTVRGRDYLGQRMTEEFALTGATAIVSEKCFRYIDEIIWGATAAVTIDVGISNSLGMRYKFKEIIAEHKNGLPAAAAGAFIPGLVSTTASIATNSDVRGRYTPATLLPDGSTSFEIRYIADRDNLYGNAQFYG